MIDQVDTPKAEYVKEAFYISYPDAVTNKWGIGLLSNAEREKVIRHALALQRRDEAHAVALVEERTKAGAAARKQVTDAIAAKLNEKFGDEHYMEFDLDDVKRVVFETGYNAPLSTNKQEQTA